MSVGDCRPKLARALEQIGREKPELLGDFPELRRILVLKYGIPPQCTDKQAVEQAVRQLKKGSDGGAGYVKVRYELPLLKGASPEAGNFPDYTLAEVLYVSLYEKDPDNAHEAMYSLLEPLLISEEETRILAKALFIPVHRSPKIWRRIQDRLVELLKHLDEGRRALACECLARNMHLMFYSLPYEKIRKGKIVIAVEIDERLFSLCPELKALEGGGALG